MSESEEAASRGPEGPGDDAGGSPVVLSVEGLVKHYGGVKALDGVSLDFHAGRVHAILGENGAGKSTLMKILAGAERPDHGTVKVDGVERSFASGADATRAGIAIVFQELSLYPDVDVLANLFAMREPRRWGLVRRREMERRSRPVLEEIGLSVDLNARLETLPLDQRQLLEIAKALLLDTRILILDEPTSALTAAESTRLFDVVRRLRAAGRSVLFVSHRLSETFEIADTISVLRDGKLVAASLSPERTSMEELVTHMIGRPPSDLPRRPPRTTRTDARLRLDGVSVGRVVHDVTLDVGEAEVVGLAGLEDSGIRPLFEAIFGLRRADRGTIELPEGRGPVRNATEAVKAGLAFVPADRRSGGLMLEQSVVENVCQITVGVTGAFGALPSRRSMREAAERACEQLMIRTASIDVPVHRLSGGNQQKVVLGKWLQTNPSIVLLDDPTRGVDVGAKLQIYQLVAELAKTGCAVLFHSSEMAEYEHVTRRVLVMRRGHLVAELTDDEIDEHALTHAVNQDRGAQ